MADSRQHDRRTVAGARRHGLHRAAFRWPGDRSRARRRDAAAVRTGRRSRALRARPQPLAVQVIAVASVRVVGAAGRLCGDGQCPVAPAGCRQRGTDDRLGGRHLGGRRPGSDAVRWAGRCRGRRSAATPRWFGRCIFWRFWSAAPGISWRWAFLSRAWRCPACALGCCRDRWPGSGLVIAGLRRIDDAGADLAGAGTDPAGGAGFGVGVAAGGRRTATATPRLPLRADLNTTFARFFQLLSRRPISP